VCVRKIQERLVRNLYVIEYLTAVSTSQQGRILGHRTEKEIEFCFEGYHLMCVQSYYFPL